MQIHIRSAHVSTIRLDEETIRVLYSESENKAVARLTLEMDDKVEEGTEYHIVYEFFDSAKDREYNLGDDTMDIATFFDEDLARLAVHEVFNAFCFQFPDIDLTIDTEVIDECPARKHLVVDNEYGMEPLTEAEKKRLQTLILELPCTYQPEDDRLISLGLAVNHPQASDESESDCWGKGRLTTPTHFARMMILSLQGMNPGDGW